MASCNDLNQQLKEIDDRLAAIESAKRGLEARVDLADETASSKPKILRTWDGKKVGVDSQEWIKQVELDAVRMGDEQVRQLVRSSFDQKSKPAGRTGRMLNYSQLEPDKDNLATLLEVMGETRVATKKGQELKQVWTAEVASKELQILAARSGGDPAEIAKQLGNRTRGLKKLPATVYMVAKAKWDSASQYADALDEMADAIEQGIASDALKAQAANVAQWAYVFEQLDAFVGRKVGQALVTRQFKQDFDLSLVDIGKDAEFLTLEKVKGNSLVADMLKLTAEGNASELRKRAAAKRLNQTVGGGVNEGGFMADLRLLNTFRRANLLSSVASWAVRNPLSGALVQATYMAEDTVSGVIRTMNKNALKPGMFDGLQASAHAWRQFNSAWGMAWGNASESFRTGKGTMGDENLKFVDQKNLFEDPKSLINNTFEKFKTDPASLANPINMFNAMNAAVWQVFGQVGERFGTDAGYGLPFRLLNMGDEFIRTQAYVWKTNHEAFLRASEEGRAAGKSIEWIQDRADELAEGLIFDGIYTDDMLAAYRRKRNAEYGIPVGDELSDDELRAMLYDQYKNAPNKNSELGAIGYERGENVTFTRPFDNQVMAGLNMTRQNPVVGWLVPFFKVPMNGIGWVLNREALIQMPRQLLMEGRQAFAKNKPFTMEEMADARARTLVSMAIAGITHALWESGVFTDGGSNDPRQRDRERRVAPSYSFSLAGTMLGAAKFRGSGIDVIDLMGLHADVLRAWHDGLIGNNDAGMAIGKIMLAHGELLKNKAALKNISDVMNWAQDPSRYDLGRLVGSQMGGLMPVSGFLSNLTRSVSDPEEMQAPRRAMTPDEMAALKKDPLWNLISAPFELLGQAFASAHANYPGIGMAVPREKDWLGNTIQRPLGLPLDMTIPFMPVIKPDDWLYKELAKHGFGDKPRPDGKVSMGGVQLQMTTEEEGYYRDQMRTIRGVEPPASSGRLLDITQYVEGNDMQGALRALFRDPDYQALLNNPGGSVSPSLKVQPGKSLNDRKQSAGGDIYAPIDDIINYYDDQAIKALLLNNSMGFAERFKQVVQQKQGSLEQYVETMSPLGVGRL